MEEHSFFGDTDTAQAPNLTPPLDGLRLGPHPDLTTPSCGVYSANMDSTLGLDNVIDECNIGENQGPRNTRRFTGLGHINLPNEGFEQHANFHPRVSPLFGSCTNCARITHVDFGESSWSSSKCFTLGSTYNLGVNNMLTSNGGWDVPNVPIEANSISQSAATVSDTSAQELLRGCSDDIEYWDRKGPKIGARFSRETTRILRDWVSAHCSHPYPSEEDKEYLMRVTSLTKPQVTNWVTNARRRGKICPPGSPSLKARKLSNSMDISGGMHLRQEASPDDEQAPAPAICEAGSLYSSKPSTLCDLPYSDGDFGSPLHNISSVGSSATSPSSSNLLFSHPLGSLGSSKERRCSREISNCDLSRQVPTAQHMYQCTFCTKTFKAKHDWQRHELMHFSPEKWICAPNGPTYTSHGHVTCVFCGLQNPSARHINDQHNYLSCAERSLTKRSFYRKDHLCQHLKGVHGIRFQSPIMDTWKVSIAELLSRCGFCGLVMKSWLSRAEHLAEHFKLGKTMADWKGDWGFDPEILGFINNAIPPGKQTILFHTQLKKEVKTNSHLNRPQPQAQGT
jgi:uncharacterized C2H2 Zn-finger protein